MPCYRQTIILSSAKCVLALVALSCSVSAQTPAPPQTEPRVRLKVIVTDRSGHSVDNVVKEDLQLLDEGNPETISLFAKTELPITYGLVMDMSGSMRLQFPDVIAAARAIVGSNRANDQTFVVRFASSDKVETVQELTSDKVFLVAPSANFDFASFNFHVPICGLSAEQTTALTKNTARANKITFTFISSPRRVVG